MRREREHPGDEMAGDWSVIEVRVEPVHLRETGAIDNRAEPTETRNVARAVSGRGAVELQRRSDKRHTSKQELSSRAQLAGRTVRFVRGVGDGHDCRDNLRAIQAICKIMIDYMSYKSKGVGAGSDYRNYFLDYI